jgi:hypothetical protein
MAKVTTTKGPWRGGMNSRNKDRDRLLAEVIRTTMVKEILHPTIQTRGQVSIRTILQEIWITEPHPRNPTMEMDPRRVHMDLTHIITKGQARCLPKTNNNSNISQKQTNLKMPTMVMAINEEGEWNEK